MNTDTPRTDIIIQQTNGFGTASAIQRLVEFSRQLERAYNEVTEQRDGLKQGVDCASDLLASVTEQRDTALRDLEFRRALYKLQKQKLYDVREQRDKLMEALEEMRYAHTDKAERMAIEALESVKKESES